MMRPLCLLLLMAARLLPAADAALPNFLPADTKALIGLRLRAITGSKLFQGLATQAVNAGSDWMTVASMVGFDPLKDIDEILIASAAGRQNAPALMVVRGRFDLERLSAGAKRYHGVALLSGSKANGTIALLDGSTALAGDVTLVHTAIDQRGGTAEVSGLLAKAEDLREHYDIWGVGEIPQGAAAAVTQAPGIDSIDRFEFGLLLSHGIEASADLHGRSAKDLEKLSASLQLFKAMASQPGQAASGVKLETRLEGNTLHLSVAVPEEELKKAMMARASTLNPVGASAAPAPAPAPVRPLANANGDTVVLTLPGKH